MNKNVIRTFNKILYNKIACFMCGKNLPITKQHYGYQIYCYNCRYGLGHYKPYFEHIAENIRLNNKYNIVVIYDLISLRGTLSQLYDLDIGIDLYEAISPIAAIKNYNIFDEYRHLTKSQKIVKLNQKINKLLVLK